MCIMYVYCVCAIYADILVRTQVVYGGDSTPVSAVAFLSLIPKSTSSEVSAPGRSGGGGGGEGGEGEGRRVIEGSGGSEREDVARFTVDVCFCKTPPRSHSTS